MKSFEKILKVIEGWPEEIRRLAAVLVMALVVAFVFWGFTRGLSSRLTALSLKSAQELTQEGLSQNKTQVGDSTRVLSPAAGLGESFKSLQDFAKGVSLPKVSLPSKDTVEKRAGSVLQKLSAVWGAFAEKMWRWIYLP